MLDDGLDDIGRRLRWRVTFWITLDEGLDDADDVFDDVLAVGRRFRWRQEHVLSPMPPPTSLTYLHIILMTDDGDMWNDVFDGVGRCWMMLWMKLLDVLDDVGLRMTFWMTDDVLDDVGWRFGWSWMTFWMMLDDVLDDAGWRFGWHWKTSWVTGYILDYVGWGIGWRWWRFGWRFCWRMTSDDASDDGRKTFYHRRRRRRR